MGLIVFLLAFAGTLLAAIVAGLLLWAFSRPLFKRLVGHFIRRLMNDPYGENLWEMVTALLRIPPWIVLENSLRAAAPGILERPFGSPRRRKDFAGLVFSPAQLAVLPAPESAYVDTRLTIGPDADKPLKLEIPLLAAGMAYGVGLNERVKIAIAKGTAAVGTATNSGEGPFLPEERIYARHFILQYHSGSWAKEPETLRQADAIEIRFGQGATAGAGITIQPNALSEKARMLAGVAGNRPLTLPSRHPEVSRPQDLKRLVDKLRRLTGGVPIGVKLAPSGWLEADLEAAVRADVDFISIDGGQGGSKAAPPILSDDFGLPTLFALTRAVRFLRQCGARRRITLLTGGGYATPGDCLKALALGADGVYMGTVVLWAMTHDQITKAIPWEPPTQLTWDNGLLADVFDVDKAATSLANLFTSFTEEMKLAVRALGKTSVRDVDAGDLVALDEWTSKITGVRLACEPWEPGRSGETGGDGARGTRRR
jgi:glutamate synthase domain-containing protein 2